MLPLLNEVFEVIGERLWHLGRVGLNSVDEVKIVQWTSL